MTPATTWNSRFAGSIPRLIGIFTGKTRKNSSDTPTSGSHNSSRPNSDSQTLYRWKEDVETFCRIPSLSSRRPPKLPLENRVKKGYAHENRGGFDGAAGVEDKTATWQLYNSRRDHTAPARDGPARGVHAFSIKPAPLPSLQHTFCSGSRPL
uniref:Uncharacterized protein n=1 Tax=Fagus sylvatica TaxID=28930 RepID=A0A2N9HCY2_FAGSY